MTHRPHAIRTPDGLTLAAYEAGNPDGPAILFIHGFCQAALSWERQLRDPDLARDFRMVALDLRGHGMSDKPVGDAAYRTDRLWADDIQAVIDQLGLHRPTLVGWSYGGRVMGDYVQAHGTSALGAMNWVGAVSGEQASARPQQRAALHALMTDADPAIFIPGTASFLRACFEIQPTTGDFETMLAFNMMVPRHARISLRGRSIGFEDSLRGIDVPVLVTHGMCDRLVDVTMGRHTAAIIPGARLSEYEGIGHAPFWEDAPRFNRELAELARSA